MTNDFNMGLEPVGDEALEARIVAWVLGEASPFEAAELEKLCEQDPEAGLFLRRLRVLDGLIRERVDDSWRLPQEKRAQVLDLIGGGESGKDAEAVVAAATGKPARRRVALRWMPAAAAVLLGIAGLGVVLGPMLSPAGMGGSADGMMAYQAADRSEAAASEKMVELMDLAESEAAARGNAVLPPELLEGTPKPLRLTGPAAPSSQMARVFPEAEGVAEAAGDESSRVVASRAASAEKVAVPESDALASAAEPELSFGDSQAFGGGFGAVGGAVADGEGPTWSDRGPGKDEGLRVGSKIDGDQRSERRRPEQPLGPMAEVLAEEEPFSTFSLHVSDASFRVAAAALQRGEVPDPEGIRPEEFYNAFDYGDPAPAVDEPVACVVEQAVHPVLPQRNLLRIAVRTGASGRSQVVPLNLTLLLDQSGSMEREDRAEGVARAVAQLGRLLQAGDKVTVAGFSRRPRLLADRLDGEDAGQLSEIVRQAPAEGGTNLEEALRLGEELARRQFVPGAQNRAVLFTDGAANLGNADPARLQRRVEVLRQHGIAFDAAGFGADGLNDRLLERLTRDGNGRYYVVDGPEEAHEGFAAKLAGAFRPAAENVKVQVVFNPRRVGRYQLIGFEEHRLRREDFRDDAVDAAEMAAEEAGVALYQIEARPEGEGEIGEVRVRFRDAASGQMVERSWTIPYEGSVAAFDRAPESVQLAGLAVLAAAKLRGAPMAGMIDFNEMAPVVARVGAHYEGAKAVEALKRMIEALR